MIYLLDELLLAFLTFFDILIYPIFLLSSFMSKIEESFLQLRYIIYKAPAKLGEFFLALCTLGTGFILFLDFPILGGKDVFIYSLTQLFSQVEKYDKLPITYPVLIICLIYSFTLILLGFCILHFVFHPFKPIKYYIIGLTQYIWVWSACILLLFHTSALITFYITLVSISAYTQHKRVYREYKYSYTRERLSTT